MNTIVAKTRTTTQTHEYSIMDDEMTPKGLMSDLVETSALQSNNE